MTRLVTRVSVVKALARREAELLGQEPSSGHVLVAIIWEGHWIAARALADAGLAKGSEDAIRQQLGKLCESRRGLGLQELMHSASHVAKEFGHGYIGTEHQLLAIIEDESLSQLVLPIEGRRQGKTSLLAQLEEHADEIARVSASASSPSP